MAGFTVRWNMGMTVATALLVVGGGAVIVSAGPGDPLWTAGIGIVTLAAVSYLGARIWMVVRKRDR